MSAPSESAASPAPCACTNISLMQLFHELKQKFPGVPDHVVSNTIELYCHDKQACEKHLHTEVKASLTHAYHASSSAAARHLNQLRLNPPLKCKNQPIVKHEISKPTAITSIPCIGPQKAILCSDLDKADKINTDANQNIVEAKNEETIQNNNRTSPVTVINIDNCHVKYNADSPSDFELTNDNNKEEKSNDCTRKDSIPEQPESTNYKINKSNKIKSNLNERLERGKEKKTIKKAEVKQEIKQDDKPEIKQDEKPETKQDDKPEIKQDDKPETKQEIQQEEPPKPPPPEKPKRPNTLDFIKPNPDTAFKQTLKHPESEPCRTLSPAPATIANDCKEPKGIYRSERGYPLNLSVNVNCHMDLSRGYGEPWLEDFDPGRAITSVNLTVCTPTSSMASPEREGEGFEGHVTVTVSPSSARAPRRRAPPPPPQRAVTPPTNSSSPRPSRAAPEPPITTIDRSLIERQKERFNRLATALAQEKGRLEQLNKETAVLAGGVPSPSAALGLRVQVERLRDQCDMLAKRLEMAGNERDDSGNFYSNIYTGQRPSSSWQCHMCTFRNHPLLDKCEECDMPRIIVGTSHSQSPNGTHDSGFGSFRDRNRIGLGSAVSRLALTDTKT